MAEEDEVAEGDEAESEGAGKSKKKLILIAAPLLLLVLGGGGYFAASYLGVFSDGDTVDVAEKMPPPKPAYYHELPEMVVNLSSREKRAQYLKMRISLEVSDQTVAEAMQPNLPRVLDLFQVYLRELRASDLEGSQGIYRLKEELLKRINLVVHPNRVNRILLKEIIIQ